MVYRSACLTIKHRYKSSYIFQIMIVFAVETKLTVGTYFNTLFGNWCLQYGIRVKNHIIHAACRGLEIIMIDTL